MLRGPGARTGHDDNVVQRTTQVQSTMQYKYRELHKYKVQCSTSTQHYTSTKYSAVQVQRTTQVQSTVQYKYRELHKYKVQCSTLRSLDYQHGKRHNIIIICHQPVLLLHPILCSTVFSFPRFIVLGNIRQTKLSAVECTLRCVVLLYRKH